MNLCDLKTGEKAIISGLETGNMLRIRLQELGFTVGSEVTCVMRSPLRDPAAYSICGTVIAVRDCDAQSVKTERCGI